MINLLLDQGIPRSTVAVLKEQGFDVLHVADIGMSTAKDVEIINYARQTQRGIVTLDADFHALLAISYASNPSVLRIRIEGLNGMKLAKLIQNVIKKVRDEWINGAIVTVTSTAIRLRQLPILSK